MRWAEDNSLGARALQLLTLTMARREEVLKMEWSSRSAAENLDAPWQPS
jgi:hypothetical protein